MQQGAVVERLRGGFAQIRKLLESKSTRNRQQFDCILDIANDIAQKNPQALVELVRLIGRRVQTTFMSELILHSGESPLPNLWPEEVLFNPSKPVAKNGDCLSDLIWVEEERRELSLSRDLILPWPWQRGRLVGTLAYIGEKRPYGAWRQDHNHNIEYWLPLGIGWVRGGNHSITAGIIQGKGSIIIEEVHDMSEVYEHVICNGITFSRRHDGSKIADVKNVEFAGIFEIGRLMVQKGISA